MHPRRRRNIILGASGVSYDADAQALFARMTTQPNATRKGIINDLILGLKADGNWTQLDVLVILAAHTSQAALLDWKNLQDGAEVLAPAFVADRGYTSDGATSYINTQFNPSTDAVLFTQNDASCGIYSRTDSTILVMLALTDATSNGTLINPRNSGNNFSRRLNSDTFKVSANATSLGFFSINRTVNNLYDGLINGVSQGTQADISQALLNDNYYFLCWNKIGTGANAFSNKQGAMYFFGSGSLNHLTFYNRIQTYMTAIGAQV